jgi:predicted permease
VDLATALRTQGRGTAGASGRPGKLAMAKLLVVGQVALSLLLLVGTAMLVRSMQRLDNADVGLARDPLVIASIDAERSGYQGARLAALLRDLTERVGQIPGVAAVTYSENGLFSGTESGTWLQVEGFTARQHADTLVAYDDVGPGYFHTIGAHLLRGRDFEPRDNEAGAKVAIVNQTMARFFFPTGNAIGRHVATDSSSFEIVGVVADVQEQAVRDEPVRRVYFPTLQMRQLPTGFRLEVQATGDPAQLVVPIRRALLAFDPTLTGLQIDPLAELTRDSISQDRLVAQVVTFFGVLALVLAALGLYGVMAHATLRRTTEFGLRMALGALPRDVTRMVLRESMLMMAGGVLLGVPAALAAMRLVQGRLFGIGIIDPPSIVFAVLVLAGSAAVASYLPALRASRVAPLEAIRAD